MGPGGRAPRLRRSSASSDSQSICRDVYVTLGAVRDEHRAHPARPARDHPGHAPPGGRGVGGGDARGAGARAHDGRHRHAATAPRTTSGSRRRPLAELREYALAIRGLMTTGRAEYHGRDGAPHVVARAGAALSSPRRARRRSAWPARSPTASVVRTGHPARDRARLDRPGARGRAGGRARSRRDRYVVVAGRRTWRRAGGRRSRRSRCRWPWRATTYALHDRGQAHPAGAARQGEDPRRALRVRRPRAAGQRQLPAHRRARAGRLPRRPLRLRRHARPSASRSSSAPSRRGRGSSG